MAFPTTLEDFTPVVDNVDDVMAIDVNELQTVIEAIQAKIGIDASAVTSSLDYLIKSSEDPGHTHTAYDLAGAAAAVTPSTLGLIIGTDVLAQRTFGTAANDDTGDFATAEQGSTADAALPKTGGTMTGKIVKAGTTEVGKTYTPATGAQTVTIDCSVNNVHIVSGHADGTAITFAISNCTNSQPFIISILQGAVVSTIAAWFDTVRWAGGITPTLTPTINKRDTFGFIRTGADTYDGFIIGQNN